MLENKYQAIDVKFLPHNYHTAKRISIHSMFQLHSSLGDLAIEKGNFRNLSRSAFNAHPPFGSIPASNQMGGMQKIAEEEEESDWCATPEEPESVMSH